MLAINNQKHNTTAFKMNVKIVKYNINPSILKKSVSRADGFREITNLNIDGLKIGTNYLFTTPVYDCNTIGVSNGKVGFMAHLIPNEKNLDGMSDLNTLAKLNEHVQKRLQTQINYLKRWKNKLTAFIAGGQILEQSERRSISLYENLFDILTKNGINPTIVWGQNTNGCSVLYSVKEDALTIWTSTDLAKNRSTIKKIFRIIKLNPEDTFSIEYDDIPRKAVNTYQNKFAKKLPSIRTKRDLSMYI